MAAPRPGCTLVREKLLVMPSTMNPDCEIFHARIASSANENLAKDTLYINFGIDALQSVAGDYTALVTVELVID